MFSRLEFKFFIISMFVLCVVYCDLELSIISFCPKVKWPECSDTMRGNDLFVCMYGMNNIYSKHDQRMSVQENR